ncbi:MAG: cupredoxin domain-containing protein [Xanthobacteraceae bacterium]
MKSRACSAALAALLIAAWAGSARAESIKVEISNLAFAPAQVTAHVGDTITWVNGDFVAHTAPARNGAWDVQVPPKASKSVVLKAAGAVDYFCKFHPQMTGKITISP